MKIKKNLRLEKRQARKNLSSTDKTNKSYKINYNIIETDYYKNAKTIGAYLSTYEEVDVSIIIKKAWTDEKSIYLPVVVGLDKPLLFAIYTPTTSFTKDILGMPIPDIDKNEYVTAKNLDLVVTPLVAFDKNRNRIGMGGGFYDRTLAFRKQQNKPKLIGAAFAIQETNLSILTTKWDIKLDAIISEEKTIK